jgi:hypothetical protein
MKLGNKSIFDLRDDDKVKLSPADANEFVQKLNAMNKEELLNLNERLCSAYNRTDQNCLLMFISLTEQIYFGRKTHDIHLCTTIEVKND